jgi:hypothetical protein
MASIRVCPETLTPTSRSAPPALRIPGSFVYFANRDSDTGQKLARPLGRFAAGPLAQADAPWPGGIDSRYLSWSLVAAFGPTDRDDRARKAAEQRIVLGWTRYFLTAQTFTANQMPLPGWRRWQPLPRVVPNLRDELARRVLPGHHNRLVSSTAPSTPGMASTAQIFGTSPGRLGVPTKSRLPVSR